jgi:hypothetical protein
MITNPTTNPVTSGVDSSKIVDIAVPIGVFVVVLVASIIVFLLWRRKRPQTKETNIELQSHYEATLVSQSQYEKIPNESSPKEISPYSLVPSAPSKSASIIPFNMIKEEKELGT